MTFTQTDNDFCLVCNLLVDDEELGGELCNFCNGTICQKCYDLEPEIPYYHYDWNCKLCLES